MAELRITLSPPLDCGKCDRVLIWLNNPLLLAENMGLDPEDMNYFLQGEIVDVTEISQGVTEYVIEYDETLLIDPDGGIDSAEVKEICCFGCLYEWIQGVGFCEIISELDPSCFPSLYSFDVSADAGTVETIDNTDELRLFGGASILTTASNPDTVTIELLLSGDAGNILNFGGDGHVSLTCDDVLGCINVQNPITGDGSLGSPFGVAISADAGNSLELRGNGLYAANTQLTCTQVQACINVDNPISGAGSIAFPFTVDLSADVGNILELRGDGLYVPNTDTVLDCPTVRACINVANPISGDGSPGDPFIIDLSADAGNTLEIRVDGLYGNPVTETPSTLTSNGLNASAGTFIAGTRLLDYTDETALVRTFTAGTAGIQYGGVSGEGIGPGFMIRHASYTPGTWSNVLNLRGAPEIAHDASYVGFTDNVPVPLDALGTYNNPIFGPYIFNNPFASRRAAIMVSTSYSAAFQKNSGNQTMDFVYNHTKSINGGAFTTVASFRRLFSGNGAFADHVQSQDRAMDMVNGPLAIGGSINLRLQSVVTVSSTAPVGSAIFPQNGAVGVEFFGML